MGGHGSQHSFLLREGIWRALGEYRDRKGDLHPVHGRAEVRHMKDVWLSREMMRVKEDELPEISNCYEIVPLTDEAAHTTWISQNPRFGTLTGNFAMTADYILSLFSSTDGRYSGTEQLLRVDEDTYRCLGMLLEGNKRCSSWAITLFRDDPHT